MIRFKTIAMTLLTVAGAWASALPVAQAESIKIGVIAAMTGGGAAWGQATAEGPRIAAAEVNAHGGLDVAGKKYQVEIIAYDDQYRAADAVAAYQRLVKQDGARYVILMSSSSALAVRQSVEDDEVVALTSAYSNKVITPETKFMFRLFSIGADYTPALVKWFKDNISERRVATVNPNDETGWDQSRLTEGLFKSNGFDVVGVELYERAQKDFQPMFTKILKLNPDLIDLGSSPPGTAGLLIRQARELGYKGKFLKTGGAGPEEIVAVAGKEASEGLISVLYADPANPGFAKLSAEYEKTKGQTPNAIIVNFYDATKVLFRAIQAAGDSTGTLKVAESFAQALPARSVQGEELTMSLNKHQIVTPMYVGVIKDGVPVVLGTVR